MSCKNGNGATFHVVSDEQLAFDYFTVPLTVTEIAKEFGEMPSAITWGITITLMLRSVGAVISGCICDR